MSSASRGSGTRRRMKLRSRGRSRLTTSEICRSCSRLISSRLAACFIYLCRRIGGCEYCRGCQKSSCIVVAHHFNFIVSRESAMATASVTVERVSWFKLKYLLIGLFGLTLAYVLGHNESFLVNPNRSEEHTSELQS